MDTVTCASCSGSRTVIETRSRWIGGTITGYLRAVTLELRCDACAGAGTVPAISCAACEAVVPASEARITIDGEGHICEACYATEQAAIVAANPELAYLVPATGPEVA